MPGAVEEKSAAYAAYAQHTAVTTPPPQAPTIAPGVTTPTLAAAPLANSRRAPRATSLSPVVTSASIEAPPDRAELLARLRSRAASLPPERVEEILSARASR